MRIKILGLLLLLVPSIATATISFDGNGRWGTTFDCSEIEYPTMPSCDGITAWGLNTSFQTYITTDGVTNNWAASSTSNEWYYIPTDLSSYNSASGRDIFVGERQAKRYYPTSPWGEQQPGSLTSVGWGVGDNDSLGYQTAYVYSTTDPDLEINGRVFINWVHGSYIAGDYASKVDNAANNPLGTGNGFRGFDGSGNTIDTAPVVVTFPEPQPEIWIRWYQRNELGYQWAVIGGDRIPVSGKNLYIFDAGGGGIVPEYKLKEYAIQDLGGAIVSTTGEQGWLSTPAIAGQEGSDGLYHCFEVHLKMDTDQTDGTGEIWIDGVLKASENDKDWSGGNTTSQLGFSYFRIGSNQGVVDNGTVGKYVDFDDVVVYNQTPPNTDAFGNPYIGPIGASPTIAPASAGTQIRGCAVP